MREELSRLMKEYELSKAMYVEFQTIDPAGV